MPFTNYVIRLVYQKSYELRETNMFVIIIDARQNSKEQQCLPIDFYCRGNIKINFQYTDFLCFSMSVEPAFFTITTKI